MTAFGMGDSVIYTVGRVENLKGMLVYLRWLEDICLIDYQAKIGLLDI